MKSIFLDIDGTLVADKGLVPESAIRAIQKARAIGHKVILCTGRAMSEIYPHILDIQFDGIVACGGNYVTTFKDVLYERTIPLADLKNMYDFFDANGINYYAEANSGLYTSENCDAQFDAIQDEWVQQGKAPEFVQSMLHFREHLTHGENLLRSDITKVSFLGSDTPFSKIKERFGHEYELFDLVVPPFGANSGEISLLGTDKTVGMEIILKHFDLDKNHAIAVGDGNNDITMLNYVTMGVAMGNATDRLKAVAQFVTKDVNEDGLAYAFETLGLMEA